MATTNKPASRLADIDMLKGFVCQLMVFAHTMTMHFGDLGTFEKVTFTFINFGAGLFFFASGMNTAIFYERNAGRTNFRATRFYLVAAAAMFVLSYPYSINRNDMQVLQIFQGIALATAATYLVLTLRLPNWAVVAIGFASYAVWVRYWQTMMPELATFRGQDPRLVLNVFEPVVESKLRVIRLLFVHFSLFPWVAYTLLGAAWHRTRSSGRAMWPWIALFALLPLIGLATLRMPRWNQPVLLTNVADMFFRNTPFHFSYWLGVTGLCAAAGARWYRGWEVFATRWGRAIWRYFEFCGMHSLLFFVWHWVILVATQAAIVIARPWTGLGGRTGELHLMWIVALAGTTASFPAAVRWGERWRKMPTFVWQAAAVIAGGTLIALRGLRVNGNLSALGLVTSFVASVVFGYLYPEVRDRLRRHYVVAAK